MSIADQLEAAGEVLSPAVRVAVVALEGRVAVLEAEVVRRGAEDRALCEQLRDLQARR